LGLGSLGLVVGILVVANLGAFDYGIIIVFPIIFWVLFLDLAIEFFPLLADTLLELVERE
jgi:hypothetical protein